MFLSMMAAEALALEEADVLNFGVGRNLLLSQLLTIRANLFDNKWKNVVGRYYSSYSTVRADR